MKGRAGRFSRFVPFNPSLLTGLTGWWDASDSSRLFDATTGGNLVAADAAIGRLEDKSGNNRHFTQISSFSRPVRKTAIQNGLDVIRFDGSNDNMSSSWTYAVIQAVNASSIFIVAKATTVGTNNADPYSNEVVFSETQGSHMAFLVKSNNTAGAAGYDGNWKTTTVSYVPGNWVAFSSWHNGSSIFSKINNDADSSTALAGRVFTSGTAFIGQNYNGTQRFDGDFGEMITYNVALSEANRNKVISFLMEKWALT